MSNAPAGGLFSRRRFLAAATVSTAGVVAGGGFAPAAAANEPEAPLGSQPPGLPARQYAWVATLHSDDHGNPIAPRFNRLLFFDLIAAPNREAVRTLEAALRSLERTYPWGPDGLLFTASWGPGYFERALGVASPVPRARELSEFETPTFDDYDLCIHLASDDEGRLLAVEHALVDGVALSDRGETIGLGGVLRWRETRSGFVGTGLPAAHQHVNGIPAGDPVAPSAPLFMGFKSGFRKNQATEDAVTISSGPFAQGTTMQVSYMRLRLDRWYDEMDERERTALMYAPEVTPAAVARFTDNPPTYADSYSDAAMRYGQVGHSQTSARARRRGAPRIIRRDFDTVDGGLAGLHFVSIQQSIEDFVKTRDAMNADEASYMNPAIGDTINNGINAFIFVLKRANYIIPSRATRSFPLYPGQAAALS